MSPESLSVQRGGGSPGTAPDARGAALECRIRGNPELYVRIPSGGSPWVRGLGDVGKAKLLAAVLDFRLDADTHLIVLGSEVARLKPPERVALRRRTAFLAAAGGLLSSLNAWENIVLPVGFHEPKRLRGTTASVYGLLREFHTEPRRLVTKLPEGMSLFEKKLAGYVRILLEKPELVLVDDLEGGLDETERSAAARFAEVYHAYCPGGTFVRLESARQA